MSSPSNQKNSSAAPTASQSPLIIQEIKHLLQIERFDLAEKELKRALQETPENRDLRNYYAFLCLRTDRLDEAEEVFRDILIDSPSFSSAKRLLARTIISKDPIESEKLFLDVLHQDPSDIYALHDYAFLLKTVGQPSKAQAILLHALSVAPEFTNAHISLAGISTEHLQIDRAKIHAQQALASDPDEARAHLALAVAEYHAGRYASAYRSAFDALRIDPNLARAESILRNSDLLARWPMFPMTFILKEFAVMIPIFAMAFLAYLLLLAAIQEVHGKRLDLLVVLILLAIPASTLPLAYLCCRLWPRRPDGTIQYSGPSDP